MSGPASTASVFPVTRWTAVLRLRDQKNEGVAQAALSSLCEEYWYPLYAFARRSGKSPHDAQDLTQGFFCYAVERNLFASADPNLGRMRTFLLHTFQRYTNGQRDHDNAQKRGGGRHIFSLEQEEGESRYSQQPVDELTPEALFEHAWAHAVLASAMQKLEALETSAGRERTFRMLSVFLAPDGHDQGASIRAAEQLGISEDLVRQNVLRLRKRFREVLRQQVAETLQQPTRELVDNELQALKAAITTPMARGSH